MKKILSFCTIIAFLSPVFAQTALPNGGLETWQTIGSYEEPTPNTFWTTLNGLVSLGGPSLITVTKSTDAADGDFAARLETKSFSGIIVPGLLNSGTYNSANPFNPLKQRRAFTDRPTSFSGSYKYTSVNGDSAGISVELSKWQNGQRVIVGTASMNAYTTTATYNTFDLSFDYFTNDTPDSINVVLVSSAGASGAVGGGGQVGSTLWVDDLAFNYSVGIEELASKLSLYPNPAQNVWNVENKTGENMQIQVWDLQGRLVWEASSEGNLKKNVSEFPRGVYLYEIRSLNKYLTGKWILE